MSSKPITNEDPALANATLAPATHANAGDSEAVLKNIMADVLGISAEDSAALNAQSGLFGHLPELDSMAVAGLLTEIEDRFDIVIDDDEVDGEMLETFGGLLDFVIAKTAQS